MIANSEFEAFIGLDLAPVKIKLMHESGEGWSPERTAAVETEYRRFLYLTKAFPQEHHAPTDDVDTFWHYHILDTMKYAADCEHLFGHFLHHFPYAGMRGEADKQALERVGEHTAMRYESTFGVRYPGRMIEAVGKASNGIIERAGLCLESPTTVQAETASPTYCTMGQAGGTGTVQAAYCFNPPPTGTRTVQAAYCFAVEPPPPAYIAQAACSPTGQAAGAGIVEAAYCFVVEPPPPRYITVRAAGAGATRAAFDVPMYASGGAHEDSIMALFNSPGFGTERPAVAR